jgi:hypothetical protein
VSLSLLPSPSATASVGEMGGFVGFRSVAFRFSFDAHSCIEARSDISVDPISGCGMSSTALRAVRELRGDEPRPGTASGRPGSRPGTAAGGRPGSTGELNVWTAGDGATGGSLSVDALRVRKAGACLAALALSFRFGRFLIALEFLYASVICFAERARGDQTGIGEREAVRERREAKRSAEQTPRVATADFRHGLPLDVFPSAGIPAVWTCTSPRSPPARMRRSMPL